MAGQTVDPRVLQANTDANLASLLANQMQLTPASWQERGWYGDSDFERQRQELEDEVERQRRATAAKLLELQQVWRSQQSSHNPQSAQSTHSMQGEDSVQPHRADLQPSPSRLLAEPPKQIYASTHYTPPSYNWQQQQVHVHEQVHRNLHRRADDEQQVHVQAPVPNYHFHPHQLEREEQTRAEEMGLGGAWPSPAYAHQRSSAAFMRWQGAAGDVQVERPVGTWRGNEWRAEDQDQDVMME